MFVANLGRNGNYLNSSDTSCFFSNFGGVLHTLKDRTTVKIGTPKILINLKN